MKLHAPSGLTWGCPYAAVGIQRALESAIGLPSMPTSALWMLAFLIPAEVRRSFMVPPEVITARGTLSALTDPYAQETGKPPKTHRLRPDPASRLQRPPPNAGPRQRVIARTAGWRVGAPRRWSDGDD